MIPSTKIKQSFNESGKFRILMISDLQETVDYDERTLRGICVMLDSEKPDLVILGGDNCNGHKLKTYEELVQYLNIFAAPMEERKIPWMHVFGNHDYDVDVPAEIQHELYRSFSHNIAGTVDGIPGVTNYAVPIYAHNSDKIAYCIYAFDTHHKNPEIRPGVFGEDLLLTNREKCFRKWDMVRFEQQMWYWNLSREIEEREGKLVRALAVMHVPPHETAYACLNVEELNGQGFVGEKVQSSFLNSGLFATMLQRGDVDIIAAAHIHRDTVDAVWGGIRLCLDGSAGFSPYGDLERRGGRVFDISEDGTHSTRMVALMDLMDVGE